MFWLVEGKIFTKKKAEFVTMEWCVNWNMGGNKFTHWFDSRGLPTLYPLINPSLISIQKDKYKQIRAATVIEESRPQRLNSRQGGTVRGWKEGENKPSVCPGPILACVSCSIHLCSFVGAKYNSIGLLTFQYFSLTSSREKEPFRTYERKRDIFSIHCFYLCW